MKKRPQTAQVSVLKLKLFSLATGAGSPEQHMQITVGLQTIQENCLMQIINMFIATVA